MLNGCFLGMLGPRDDGSFCFEEAFEGCNQNFNGWMIDEFFEGGGAAFFEGVNHSGSEGGIFFKGFDHFGANHGLAAGGSAIVVAIELV